ncbi:hypothetical protein E4U43_000660 [Claviceps pusilla]|uniref:Uncharacterized protein n=1 Tax=Claviceps pusilla TaxID=123648 RepID=A0A9P7N976_9HYPO|nr:hypothetical protein E4U43_000660 [Claviceps pusilla]
MSEKDARSSTAAEKDKQSSDATDNNKSSNPSDKNSTASSLDGDDYEIGVAKMVNVGVKVTPAQAKQLSSSGAQAQKNRSSGQRR